MEQYDAEPIRTAISHYLALADAVTVTDEQHRVIDANARYEYVTGYARDEIVGLRAGILKSGLTPQRTYDRMKEALQEGRPWSGVFINRQRNGELWHSHITITPVTVDGLRLFVGVFRDLNQINEGMYVSEERRLTLQQEILKVLALSSEVRDPEIEGHLSRVQALTEIALRAYKEECDAALTEEYIRQVIGASIMHDIGKSGIPEGILYKPGKLTSYERHIIETHPLIGVDILNKISNECNDALLTQELAISRSVIEFHHEKWDGTGYPHGLDGADIPFEARVVSLVDVYDALVSKRPYKEAWPKERALQYLVEQKGRFFQASLVDTFVRALRDAD